MGEGREHQKYEDAPLFRTVITLTRLIDGHTETEIKGPFNSPGPARAAKTRAEKDFERYPRRGWIIKVRVNWSLPDWFDLE